LEGDVRGQVVKESLLVVDDDRTLLRFIKEYLEREGFEVMVASGGEKALRLFYQKRPELVVVDIMMPGMDGWELCARLRELSDTPVVMLTAKTSENDKLRGFRLGVDDYITKPFSMAELVARIRAILARSASPGGDPDLVRYQIGELAVDARKRQVLLKNDVLDLTPTEYRLIEVLARRPGEAISQDEIISTVWGDEHEGGGSALRRYIWLLRQKVETDPKNPERIVTLRGFGYRLEG
jgi:two-component system KDP operon response regulator KdpE